MYEDFDSDVLAVLVRGDVKIIFVNTPDTGIDGKDFSVISWTSENLTIAVSDRYLNREIDNFVTDGISKMLGDNVSDDEMAQVVREHAILLFSEKLTMLSEEAISSVHNPLELSLDYTLTQLLSGTTD
jgi:hypothetical protein